VLVFILLGFAPLPLVLALVVALYLTYIELRSLKPHWQWWAWWFLLVFMTHFVGYLLLRTYALYQRWTLRRTRA
jgi:hypothetical protein